MELRCLIQNPQNHQNIKKFVAGVEDEMMWNCEYDGELVTRRELFITITLEDIHDIMTSER